MNEETKRFLFFGVVIAGIFLVVGIFASQMIAQQKATPNLIALDMSKPMCDAAKDLNILKANDVVLFNAIAQSSYWNSCTPDFNRMQQVEIPIDNQGTVRKMNAIVLYCPITQQS